MTHKNADGDPEDQTTVPPTLDSFDPLRDAETLLDDGTPKNEEVKEGDMDSIGESGSAAPEANYRGPEDMNEDDARFDAG
ncbi:hypothetical protein ACIPUB_08940 [Paeniglutamicibacter sp. ORCA_105]|uniref:hypothetical protein n=1 Tax=Paeniglutamicibacter sp. ORCA_105 TaxID=3377336 RepID=UPI003893613A